MSKRYLITATVAAAAAAALTLSACSNSGTSPSHSMSSGTSMSPGMSMSGTSGRPATALTGAPATGPHNAADIAFATDMIPHHAQALEMAKMALATSSNPKVKQLARMIEGEQTPEITTMSGWLTGWNKPVPSTSMGGMNMGGTSMPGMMSDADMSKLNSSTGAAFDKLFLTQMITHHTGALTMADTELSNGQNVDAKTLARSIIAGQSKEITTMKTCCRQLSREGRQPAPGALPRATSHRLQSDQHWARQARLTEKCSTLGRRCKAEADTGQS